MSSRFEIRPSHFYPGDDRYLVWDLETDTYVSVGDRDYCQKSLLMRQFAENKPNCGVCGHEFLQHLVPFTKRLREQIPEYFLGLSHPVDCCDFTVGGWDAGCNCTGYKEGGHE